MKNNQDEPHVVVLILSYNGKNLLEETISSYLKNVYSNFQVIVIDNGSTDGTEDYVIENFPEVTTIRIQNNRGYSGGFNFGLKYVIDKLYPNYVLITNNDVVVDKNVISELVKVAEVEPMIGFVTGKVYFHESPNKLQSAGRKSHPKNLAGKLVGNHEIDIGKYEEIKEYDFCDDVFLLVSRRAIIKTGGYDTDFYLYYEETDWCIRVRKAGFKIIYTPKAKIWHKVSQTTGGGWNKTKIFHQSRNRIIFMRKNLNKTRFFFAILELTFYRNQIMILGWLIKKKIKLINPFLKGYMSGLKWIISRDNYNHSVIDFSETI